MIETLHSLLKPLYVITSFQTGFFCLFIFTTRVKKNYHNWLSLLLFTLFVTLTFITLRWQYNIIEDSLFFRFLTIVFEYAISPLFYIFILKVAQQKIQYQPKAFLLFIPFAIGLVFLFLPQYLWDQYWLQYHMILTINFYSHSIIFLVLAYRVFKDYQIEVKNHVSQNYLFDLNVIRLVLISFVLILCLGLVVSIVRIQMGFQPSVLNPIIEMIMLISINVFLFLGLKLPLELTEINIDDTSYQSSAEGKEKYKKSTLTKDQKNELSERLKELVVDKKYYRTPNLTIKQLSEKLDTKSKYLSQTINEMHDQNFCDYINTLRIDDAKSLFKDKEGKQRTILEVCYEVGFNSKSTFNEVFKKQTGSTPTAFINSDD